MTATQTLNLLTSSDTGGRANACIAAQLSWVDHACLGTLSSNVTGAVGNA